MQSAYEYQALETLAPRCRPAFAEAATRRQVQDFSREPLLVLNEWSPTCKRVRRVNVRFTLCVSSVYCQTSSFLLNLYEIVVSIFLLLFGLLSADSTKSLSFEPKGEKDDEGLG